MGDLVQVVRGYLIGKLMRQAKPDRDAGSSPLTLAWVLKGTDPRPALKALGWSAAGMEELLAFRDWLIDRLAAAAAPE